jgi:MarR family transcriptional regulator, organic hydroperoxide resistance regulator
LRKVDPSKNNAAVSSFRLYFTLNQAQHRLRKSVDRRCLAQTGASSAQLGALYFIRDHQPCAQSEIAGAFGQDESAATGMLARMEKGGFIQRVRDADDRRVTRVSLSDSGAEALARADALLGEFNARLTRGMSRRDLAVVRRFLESVIERVDAGDL